MRTVAIFTAVTLTGAACTSFGQAGLIIIPTYDSTVLSDPNVVAITNTINTAILSFESRYADPVTVQIQFAEMSGGLGQSQSYLGSIPYSAYYSALVAASKTSNDTVALANLPGGSVDPVVGGANIDVTLPLLRALGFSADPPPGAYDSIVSVNMSLINITRPPANPNDFDLQAVVSHEIDEVLGTSSGLGQPDGNISPVDLFRYSSTGARNFTTSGDDAYFSIDGGVTLLARYNQQAGADYGDWWSFTAHSPIRVQDAFGTPGSAPDLGVELTVLDVIGWDLVPVAPQPLVQASLSGKTINLIWNSTAGRSYQVQYNTNLTTTNWVDLGGAIAAVGTTTTTNDTTASVDRFYRVHLLPLSARPVQASVTARMSLPMAVKGPFGVYKHVTHPRME